MTGGCRFSVEPLEFDHSQLASFIEDDDVDEFVSLLQRQQDVYDNKGQVILGMICQWRSIRCAEAMITGQTPVNVDVNLPCCPKTGMYPLHVASISSLKHPDPSPAMIELLLYYGARTDIPYFIEETMIYCSNTLPLQMAFRGILDVHYPSGWTPKQSIYKLITILCLPRLQNRLECIALLAGTTKETGEVLFQYAVEGNITEFAALLMVSPKEKLLGVMDRVHQHLDYSVGSDNTFPPLVEGQKEKMQQLLQVFDKVGDAIFALVKGDRFFSNRERTSSKIGKLLRDAGFCVLDAEIDLSDDKREFYHSHNDGVGVLLKKAPYEEKRCLNDFGMAHYSMSGYRWTVSNGDWWLRHSNHEAYVNKLAKKIESLKEEKVSIGKLQQELNLRVCMDDELWTVLEKDDKEGFISLIARKVEFFGSRQQQVLYAVCSSRSVKCAEALIKGETPLNVDLNCPCTDTGLYPLHCAALSLFPSITELLLYHGAENDVIFKPQNPSGVFPRQLIEEHANKLPLHMALNVITCLPCIREWTSQHSVQNLVTLLCLPRMQDSLETLELLAMATEDLDKEFLQLVMDGKLVEVAALLTVAYRDVMHIMFRAQDKYSSIGLYHLDDNLKERGLQLFELFDRAGEDIAGYVKEEKNNVSKYQVIEDVTWIVKSRFLPELVDIDLSIYNWYRNEESTRLSEAPYEHVKQLDDIGMEHYSKSSFRWRGSKKMFAWRHMKNEHYIHKMEGESALLWEKNYKAGRRLEKDMKPATSGTPYILRHGFPIASSSFFSHSDLNAHKLEKASRGVHILHNRSQSRMTASRAISSMTSSFRLGNLPTRMKPLRVMSLLISPLVCRTRK